MNVHRHFKSTSALSEQDMDTFDQTASTFLRTMSEQIQLLSTIRHLSANPTQRDHDDAVVQWLRQRLARMASQVHVMQESRAQKYAQAVPELSLSVPLTTQMKNTAAVSPVSAATETHGLQDAQERLMLEEENEILLAEFTGMEVQVRQAEKSLLEIAQLQSTLEHHVVSQYQEMQRLHDEAVGTTDTVRSGNAVLAKATQRGVEFRNFMLFFFLLLSLILLFLHYYES